MVQDLSHNLCESLVENIDGVAGIGKHTPPTPIVFLTQWKIVGNSEVHGQEIWSCGEYNATDGKYHILVQPQGYSIADIALTEPLRKVNDVADTIEFPSNVEGKALVTRKNDAIPLKHLVFSYNANRLSFDAFYSRNKDFTSKAYISNSENNMLTPEYEWIKWQSAATDATKDMKIMMSNNGDVKIRDLRYDNTDDFYAHIDSYVLLFIIATPTTELVDAPQIAEAESYSCIISQGGKAVSWSSFETN